jgi:hypothetical protein
MNKYLLFSLLALTSGASAMNSSFPWSPWASSGLSSIPCEIYYFDKEGPYAFFAESDGPHASSENVVTFKWKDKLREIRTIESLYISKKSMLQTNAPGSTIPNLRIIVSRRPGAQGNNSSNTFSDPKKSVKALQDEQEKYQAKNQGPSSSK